MTKLLGEKPVLGICPDPSFPLTSGSFDGFGSCVGSGIGESEASLSKVCDHRVVAPSRSTNPSRARAGTVAVPKQGRALVNGAPRAPERPQEQCAVLW